MCKKNIFCGLPILLLVWSLGCTGSKKTVMGTPNDDISLVLDNDEHGDPIPATLSRSVDLSTNARLIMDDLARGERSRSLEECLVLEVAGAKAGNRTDVAVHVFLNMPGADLDTSTEIPNYVGTFGLGFGADPEKGSDYVFDLDNIVENMIQLGLIDQNRPDLEVNFVAFSLASDSSDLPVIDLEVSKLAIAVNCD